MQSETLIFPKKYLSFMQTSIFQSQTMTVEFALSDLDSAITPLIQRQKPIQEIDRGSETLDKQQQKSVSRLEIQIRKNNLEFVPVGGELFLMWVDADLQGKSQSTHGRLMLTNYRILFFHQTTKLINLPFGLIGQVQYSDKYQQVIYRLKYPHFWTFYLNTTALKFQQFKQIGGLYYKSSNIRNSFAFQHGSKSLLEPEMFDLIREYQINRFQNQINREYTRQFNVNYQLCQTYPPIIYVPNCKLNMKTLSYHRKNNRLPILAFVYNNVHRKIDIPLWISSNYDETKPIDKHKQKQLIKGLQCNLNLQIFVAQSKPYKAIEQTIFCKDVNITYLKLQNNQQLRQVEINILKVFILNKQPFIKEVANSKWYLYITKMLQSCQLIRNQLLNQKAVLIRCQQGYDKSLSLAALTQIILEPHNRTFNGFQALVMRMFVCNGHPFSIRLGQRGQLKDMCPIFLQFLDCVSQLINQNITHFQFNFKYLSKLSNLMTTNIYGTFIANSHKQFIQQRIQTQTVSIWKDLISPITTNSFYSLKFGVLQIDANLSSMRLWKEHFSSLITRKQDHYCFDEDAEDNGDYLNLNCLKLRSQNQTIKRRLKQKQKILSQLQ